jgi:glutathione S-transferase
MPTVHGVPLSPFVRKVRVALFEKGVSHDVVPTVPLPPANDDPAFRKMSPLGKIPAYEDGDFTISDSSVILNYLESSEPKLLPDDAKQRARALWFEEFADSKLAENVGTVFFNRIVAPNILKQEGDQAAIDAALNEELPPLFDYLEGQLGDNEYLAAGRFTVGDVAVGSMLRQFQFAGESVDAARWPKLAAYAERILSRPSFKTAADEENQIAANM